MKPLRVLHVLGAMDYGGIETWLMQVLRRIDPGEFRFDFCCLSGRPGIFSPEIRALGGQLFAYRIGLNLPRFNAWFGRLLESGRYDIVHSHVHKFSGYILRRASKAGIRGRIAHSFTVSTRKRKPMPRALYEDLMDRLIQRYANLGLANSISSMTALFGGNWKTDPRWRLLYCGIDLSPYRRPNDRRAALAMLGIPENATVIGHLGRLTPAKNHGFFLDVAKELQKRLEEAWFLIMGDGELRGFLEARVGREGLKHVVLAGRMSDEAVTAGLRNLDLMVFPSLREGLPQAIIEAQAAGLRCLCSENVTPEVVVNPGAVRFMSLDESPARWAESCLEMLRLPRLDRDSAVEGVRASHFNISESVSRLCGLYKELALS
jgi:glycosyltransferase involved in cell wall biosynthesis